MTAATRTEADANLFITEMMLGFINSTITKGGLKVTAGLLEGVFKKGWQVVASVMKALSIQPQTATEHAGDADPMTPGFQLPTSLAGTKVQINGIFAPLLYASPKQLNFIIPAGVAPSVNQFDLAAVVATSGDGSVSTGEIFISPAAPAVFTMESLGSGAPSSYLVRIKNGGNRIESPITRDRTTGALAFNPIDLGDGSEEVFLVMFLTGIRRAPDANGDGNLNETTRVVMNGLAVTPSFAGAQPDFPGLDQINVQIPRRFLGASRLEIRVFNAAGYGGSGQGQNPLVIASNMTIAPLLVPPLTQTSWRHSGLGTQDVHALAAGDGALAAGATEGIFRTVNDGQDWLSSQFGLPINEQPRRTTAILLMDSSGWLAGTDGQGVWYSFSAGFEIWTTTEAMRDISGERVLSLAVNNRTRFAGTVGKGVFRDGYPVLNPYSRWQSAGLPGETVSALAATGDRVLAGVQGKGLMATTNDGDAWSKVEGGLPADVQILCLIVSGPRVYAGTQIGLWRSINHGVDWTEIVLPSARAVNTVLSDGPNLFLGTGAGVLVSNDDGLTWKSYDEGLTNLNVLSLLSARGRLFAGTKGGGVFMTPTVDNPNRPPTVAQQTLALDEDTSLPITLTGGDPDGNPITYRIVDRPKKGSLSGEGSNLVYRPSLNTFGQDRFTVAANDGEQTGPLATVTIEIRPTPDPVGLEIYGDKSAIVGGLVLINAQGFDPDGEAVTVTADSPPQDAVFEKSSNGVSGTLKWVPKTAGTKSLRFIAVNSSGETLTKTVEVTVTPPFQNADWNQVPLFTDKVVSSVLTRGRTIFILLTGVGYDRATALLRSIDGGKNWTNAGTGLPSSPTWIAFVKGGEAIYLQSSEGVYRSDNDGLNWINVTAGKGLPNNGRALAVAADGKKLFGCSGAQTFLSLDGGGAWREETDKLPLKPTGSSVGPGGSFLALGLKGDTHLLSYSTGILIPGAIVYRSLDGGATWSPANTGLAGTGVSRFSRDGDKLYSHDLFAFYMLDERNGTWKVLSPLFSEARPDVSTNTAAVIREGVLFCVYGQTELQISLDNGVKWKKLALIPEERIGSVAIGEASLFAVTESGKLFIHPRN
jgi:uncharacterized protein (TIGR03437 family)